MAYLIGADPVDLAEPKNRSETVPLLEQHEPEASRGIRALVHDNPQLFDASELAEILFDLIPAGFLGQPYYEQLPVLLLDDLPPRLLLREGSFDLDLGWLTPGVPLSRGWYGLAL